MLLPVSGVLADTLKIGYVNIQRIFRDAPAAAAAQKKIEAEFSRRDQELQRLAKQIQSMEETLNKNGLTISESERRTKERDINDLTREFQRKQREFREDLNLRQNEENALIFEKANKAVKQIFDDEKYNLILQDAVFWSPSIDITDRVIKVMSSTK
ncbi:MAG: OmpH family outer membrane protein [Candidatus Accumulibacter sp.]|jgi:outer membrane protein|nr:OmpH family outer membrane protein [Accumulibacter sp.]